MDNQNLIKPHIDKQNLSKPVIENNQLASEQDVNHEHIALAQAKALKHSKRKTKRNARYRKNNQINKPLGGGIR